MKNLLGILYIAFVIVVMFSILVLATAFMFNVPIVERITDIIEIYINEK